MNQPINENFTSVRRNLPLLIHVIRVRLVALFTLAKPHMNLIDVVLVLRSDKETL